MHAARKTRLPNNISRVRMLFLALVLENSALIPL